MQAARSAHPKPKPAAPAPAADTDAPLISVIVPVYNVAKILERCVNSIRDQTYQNLEIILVDDGSTDLSGKFCDAFAKLDSRIKVFHQANQGLSAARNTALDHARGRYITFVDSDDAVQPDLVAYLYELILREQAQVSICSFVEVFPDHRRPFISPAGPDVQTFGRPAALQAMLLEQGFTMSAWGKLYAAELFRSVRYPVGKLYEDVGTTYKLILNSQKVVFGHRLLYDYYQNPESITKQSFSFRKLDLIDLTDQMCDAILAELPQLADVTRLRRAHARFSVLRQMTNPPRDQRSDFLRTRRQIIRYLRGHRQDVLANPLATRRDRLAMQSLLCGWPVFRLAWRLYQCRR